MGTLHDAVVAASTENERKALKAQAWAAEGLAEGWNFNYRGHKVELTAAMDASSGDVLFTARIEKAGVDVTPPDLNPIRIVNPPYLVEDAAGDVTIAYLDADGQEQTITAREDVPARIISQLSDLADKVIDA